MNQGMLELRDEIYNNLPENDDLKKTALKQKLAELGKILPKIGRDHAEKLVESLSGTPNERLT